MGEFSTCYVHFYHFVPIVVGSLATGGESDGDYSDDDDEDQGSETNGSMTEDYTDLATSQDGHYGDGHHGDGRDIAVMRQQMEGKTRLDYSKEQSLFLQWWIQGERQVRVRLSVQFLLFSCSCRQKSCQTIGFRPKPRGWCPPRLVNPGPTTVNGPHFLIYEGFFSKICNL